MDTIENVGVAIKYDDLAKMVSAKAEDGIQKLELARYNPCDPKWFKGSPVNQWAGIQHLIRCMLLKRLESSVHAFSCSLDGIRDATERVIDGLENTSNLTQGMGADEKKYLQDNMLSESERCSFEWEDDSLRVEGESIDRLVWKKAMEKDIERIDLILKRTAELKSPDRDRKMQEAFDLVHKHQEAGVIVFSEYADTANIFMTASNLKGCGAWL